MTKSSKSGLAIFQKKRAIFITVDGKQHIYTRSNYLRVSNLFCSYEKYAMISISEDGYILDDEGIMYPLQNVVSIAWDLIDEIRKIDKDDVMFKVWYTKNEIDKWRDYE